jgi:hypothetical protein
MIITMFSSVFWLIVTAVLSGIIISAQIVVAEPEDGDSSDKPTAKSATKEAKDQTAKEGDRNAQQSKGGPTNEDKASTEKEDSTVDLPNGDKGCDPGDHTKCQHYAKPKVTCPVGYYVKNGVCNKDIFINLYYKGLKKTSAGITAAAPRNLTGTLVDCNIVAATPAYFSQLAIQSCNYQYSMHIVTK